jgi:drug/metabolite transporter (DMT)-like permease
MESDREACDPFASIQMEVKGVGYALGAAALFGASTPAAKTSTRRCVALDAVVSFVSGSRASVIDNTDCSSLSSRVRRKSLAAICRQSAASLFFGGMLGPVLMLVGLQSLSALTGSLLLNLEGPFTVLIVVGMMREHLGKREMFAAATILLGGVLSTEPAKYSLVFCGNFLNRHVTTSVYSPEHRKLEDRGDGSPFNDEAFN